MPEYFHYLLKTAKVRKDMTSRSGGSTRYNIGQDSLSDVSANIAQTLPEQQKIAEFFGAVDEKIAQLQKKKDLLEDYKKGCMQKLFSQELRFTDDNRNAFPDWENQNLSDVLTITTGKKDVNEGNPNGKYPFFTCAKTYTYSDSYSFEGDAILIAGNGEVGHCQIYSGKFEAYQRTYVLQKFSIDFYYIYSYLSTRFTHHVSKQRQMGAMPYIKVGTLQGFPIPVPCLEEQAKISKFCMSINNKLALVAEELDKAKTFKKGLLQQMFV